MLVSIFALAIGLLIGSFLNVCIYRMPRDLSVVRPRSFCPNCEHMIAWYDNIPIASYFLLGRKCRHCGRPISARYPIVEALTGILFFFSAWLYGPGPLAMKYCFFSALMIGLVFSDLEERILPNEFTVGGAVAGILLAAWVPTAEGVTLARMLLPAAWGPRWLSVAEALMGALFCSLLLWFVGWAYLKVRHKEGLGLGDVKMIAAIGAFLGLYGAMATMILGSLVGSVIGLLYIFIRKKDASTYELPFGTFLGIAAIGYAVFGDRISAWWLGLAR